MNSRVKVDAGIFLFYHARPPSCVHEFVFVYFLVHSADETIHSGPQLQIKGGFSCAFYSVIRVLTNY